MAERRSHLTLMGFILVALLGAALLAVPGTPIHKKPTLGLDLQGGLEVVLKAKPDKGQPFAKSDIQRSVEIMRSRVDKLGVSEPEIRTQGSDQIVIELAGVHNQERAAELIGKTAKLELYDLQGDLVTGASLDLQGFPVAQTSVFQLLSTVQSQAKNGTPRQVYLVRTIKKGKQAAHRVVVGPDLDARRDLQVRIRQEGPRQEGPASEGHRDPRRSREHGRHHVRQGRAVLPRRK